MFEDIFKGSIVDVYINNPEKPTFEGYKFIRQINAFICLENPSNFNFIYVNLNNVLAIQKSVTQE